DPATTSHCKEPAGYPSPSQRISARTEAISLPAFRGVPAPDDSTSENRTLATYNFSYSYAGVSCVTSPCISGSANELMSVQFPAFSIHSNTSPPRYSMSFAYYPDGELASRTLPTGASVGYLWAGYFYVDLNSGSGGYYTGAPSRYTRHLASKVLSIPDDTKQYSWTYSRDSGSASTYYTNPKTVTVTGVIVTPSGGGNGP